MTCRHCGAPLEAGHLVCLACGREQEQAERTTPEPEQPVAHAEPCPKHPALPIAGSCPRCGAFVCIRCAPKAASAVLTCTDCLAREQEQYALKPSPFGGPLVFPLLGLVLKSFVFLAVSFAALTMRGPLTPAQQLAALLVPASLALAVPSFAGFLLRKRWLPYLLAAAYALDAVIAGIGWRPSSVAWVAWSLTWSLYFLTSKRVKATFTE